MNNIECRLQTAGVLIILGLIVQAICLLWAKPIAFILMVAVGGFLCLAGVAVFLFSLVSQERS